jgi:serine/threonine protein kinase
MAQMIEMFKNDYLKSSIQKTIDHIQKKDDIKQVNTNKINEIYEKGCLYKKHYEGIPIICPFKKIFKIPKHVNPIDIVTLFFPLSFIKNTSIEKISRPTILEQKPKTGGGVLILTEDHRRHIYTIIVPELAHYEEFNYGRFVMKIALNKNYSQAYDIEGKVYEGMKNHENVVKMYRAGKFDKDNIDFWEKDTNKISMKTLLNTNLDIANITLPNADLYKDMSFLLLEHCFNHQTLSNYVRNEEGNIGSQSYQAFKKTMIAVQVLNRDVGFFHGDLHTDNVLINTNGDDVKLFDFDFSALLGKQIISNNLLLYNLTWKQCNNDNEECKVFIEENNVVKVQPSIEKMMFDINKFIFIFDYFRLLFSILKKRRISDETFSDYPEFEIISKNILLWYNTELIKNKDYDWNKYFEGNVFLPIYNFIQANKEHNKKNKEEINKLYAERQQAIIKRQFVKTESDMSSFFDSEIKSSNNGSKGGGNKLKKYTRLGRAQINKDSKRTSRVIYKSGNGYYIRDVKGIYTLVKKKDLTFA